MNQSQRSRFQADFETTTDPEDCRVWLWGVTDIDDNQELFDWGTSIDTFFEWCANHTRSIVYFHNLAFDGPFILDRLLNANFRHVPNDTQIPLKGFTTLIDGDSKFYSITVRWGNNARTEFRDSFKKLPLTVARIGISYGTGLTKGELDYHKYRQPGYQPNDEELDYLYRDIAIVAKALKIQFDSGMNKLTTGADSLSEYKALIGSRYFRLMFPVLATSMDSEIRKAYRGGWTYADERRKGKVTGGGRVFDVNSLYPYVMASRVLPYDFPLYANEPPKLTEKYPLAIFSVTFTARLKPDHVPCIQVKNSPFFLNTEYQVNITEPTTLVCTNVDWELWNDHYDIEVHAWGGTYYFRGEQGLFEQYISKWAEIKENSKGGVREVAKLHLNALYGKFATNPDVTGRSPVLVDGVVELVKNEPEFRDPVYTPTGVFITSYARDITVRAAQANYATFAYADTDSLHLITDRDPENLDIDDKRMGAWKRELIFHSAFYARAKAYCEKVNLPRYHRKQPRARYITHIAGLPLSVAKGVTLSDFTNGRVFKGKLRPRRVKGGIVLEEIDYTLKFE